METCSQFKVVIDLDKMIESDIAEWLRTNGRFICFSDTHGFIEDAHRIKEQTIIQLIESSNLDYTSYTLREIKAKIKDRGGDFDFDRYFTYLTFMSNANKIDFDLLSKYDSTRNCYSIPCLRSIVLKNNFNDDTIFEFAETTITSISKIIFRVNVVGAPSPNRFEYYNYSDEPRVQFMMAI